MSIDEFIIPGKSNLAVLLDPEKQGLSTLDISLDYISQGYGDLILIGGSTKAKLDICKYVNLVRDRCPQPILLFPGDPYQLTDKADAILLPSLLSGDSFDHAFGKHIQYAQEIANTGLPIFSCGYILIEGGIKSTTAKLTDTTPLSRKDPDTIVRTALAAEQLGYKAIYLEAGSGARHPLPKHLIQEIRTVTNTPIIVGGGINSIETLSDALAGGPDLVVIGNALEQQPHLLPELYTYSQNHMVQATWSTSNMI